MGTNPDIYYQPSGWVGLAWQVGGGGGGGGGVGVKDA